MDAMEGIEPGGEGVAPAANTPPSDAGEADPSLGAIAVELAAIKEEMARLAGRKVALETLQWELGLAGPLGPPPPDGENDASAGDVEAGAPTAEEGSATFDRLVAEYRGLWPGSGPSPWPPETPKPGQERVLAAICSDWRDCVAVMPTGGGKTLCYELPAVVAWAKRRKVTVVVTMLRELVRQQTETLKKRHGLLFAAHSLRDDDEPSTPDAEPQLEPEDPAADESGDELVLEDATFAPSSLEARMVNAQSGLGVALMNPENLLASDDAPAAMKRAAQLRREAIAQLVREERLACVVVDECHITDEWKWRAAARELGRVLRELLGDAPVPVCGLTATETREGTVAVAQSLQLKEGWVSVRVPLDRRELRYSVVDLSVRQGSRGELLRAAVAAVFDAVAETVVGDDALTGSRGLFYVSETRDCKKVADALRKLGIPAFIYHAKLSRAERATQMDHFLAAPNSMMVATLALSLGLDEKSIRLVVHLKFPVSVRTWIQEMGRAGRHHDEAQRPSHCIYVYHPRFLVNLAKVSSLEAGSSTHAMVRQALNMVRRTECHRNVLLRSLGDRPAAPCAGCSRCHPEDFPWATTSFKMYDATEPARALLRRMIASQNEGRPFYFGALLDDKECRGPLDAVKYHALVTHLLAVGMLRVEARSMNTVVVVDDAASSDVLGYRSKVAVMYPCG